MKIWETLWLYSMEGHSLSTGIYVNVVWVSYRHTTWVWSLGVVFWQLYINCLMNSPHYMYILVLNMTSWWHYVHSFRIQTYRKVAPMATHGRDIYQTIQRYYRNAFTGNWHDHVTITWPSCDPYICWMDESVLISEVSWFQGLKCIHIWYFGKQQVSYFLGILICASRLQGLQLSPPFTMVPL